MRLRRRSRLTIQRLMLASLGMMRWRRLGLRKSRLGWRLLRLTVPILTGSVMLLTSACLRSRGWSIVRPIRAWLMRGLRSFQVLVNRWMFLTLSRGITTSILTLASYTRSRGFKLAITSEIIGKLGGRVEEATVAGREITSSNTVVHTVEVPAGKQVLVGFIGRFSKTPSSAASWPVLRLGTSESTTGSTSRDVAISAILAESGSLTISAGSGALSSILSGGTVYTAEM